MRGTVSRDMVLTNVFVPDEASILPPGLFGAAHNAWPHGALSFSATFLGLMQAAYDFTIAYLTGRVPGAPGMPTEVPAKGYGVAQMLFTLEAARALFYRAISECRAHPPKAVELRARAAHVTIQRGVVELTRGHPHLRRPGDVAAVSARALRAGRPRVRGHAAVDPGYRHAAGLGDRARCGLARGSGGCEVGSSRLNNLVRRFSRHLLSDRRASLTGCHLPRHARRVAMRTSAACQPAVKGCPASSRSITTGAWSEGIGLPLRASRSISAHTVRVGDRTGHQQMIDAHAEVLVEVCRRGSPTTCSAGLGVVKSIRVDQSPTAEPTEGLSLGRRDVRPAVAGLRIPDVVVFGGDVEVAAERQELVGIRGSGEPTGETLEPGELGLIEGGADRSAHWARMTDITRMPPQRQRSCAPRPTARRRRRQRSSAGAAARRSSSPRPRCRSGSRSRPRSIGLRRGAPARIPHCESVCAGASASASLVSCISSTSGRARSSHQVTLSSRAFSELTFQVAIRTPSRYHPELCASTGLAPPAASPTIAECERTHEAPGCVLALWVGARRRASEGRYSRFPTPVAGGAESKSGNVTGLDFISCKTWVI